MATFFGEILPVVSRAVDDDDDESSMIDFELKWMPTSNYTSAKSLQADSLILAVGSVATGFVESYCVRNAAFVKLGSINEIVNDNESTIHKQKENKVLMVYLKATDDANVVFCTCNSYLAPDKLWCYKEKLFSLEMLSELKEAIILDSLSTHEYFHHEINELQSPFVKSVCTTSYKGVNPLFQYLEQPNMIKGLSAAVLTTCEVKRIPAVLYTCYTDSISLSISSINAFTPLLHHKAFVVEQDKTETLKHMKALISIEGSEHALYT